MPETFEKQLYVSTDVAHQNFINTQWRPWMAWLYMATCVFDFLIAPILWPIFTASLGLEVKPWSPITLQGAGLYHLSMGAILGVTSWQRSQERISAMNLQMNYTDVEVYNRKMKAVKNKLQETDDADALIGKKSVK